MCKYLGEYNCMSSTSSVAILKFDFLEGETVLALAEALPVKNKTILLMNVSLKDISS